jgi:hypothetical protein
MDQLIRKTLEREVRIKRFKLAILREITNAAKDGLTDEEVFGALESAKHLASKGCKYVHQEVNETPQDQLGKKPTHDDSFIGYL